MLDYRKQLFDNGFCIIPDITSKDNVIALREKYLPYFSENKLTFTVDEILANSDLYDILFSPQIIEAIINLLGSAYCMYPDFTLRSSVYVSWHVDVPYLSTNDATSNILPNFMQVLLYLQDNTTESGDGCMLMTGMEIQTAAKYGTKVLFIVLNNGAHGAIKNANAQYPQIGLTDHQYDIPTHDWALFAKSFGVPSLNIKTIKQLSAALEMFRFSGEPLLLDIVCHYDSNVNINWYYEEFIRLSRVNDSSLLR